MKKENLQRYAELESKKREIEAIQDMLKADILEEVKKSGLKKVESDFGDFTLVIRKTWKYSPTIKALEDGVKAQKKVEETTGVAVCEEKESLTFYPVKEIKNI